MNCRLTLSIILLAQDYSGGLGGTSSRLTVQGRSSSWIPGRRSFRPSLPTTTTTAKKIAQDGDFMQYKRKEYESIVTSLRVRGGANDVGDDSSDDDNDDEEAANNDTSSPSSRSRSKKRRRRRKKSKTESNDDANPPMSEENKVSLENPIIVNDDNDEDVEVTTAVDVDGSGLGEEVSNAPLKKKVRKRGRRISRMFGRNDHVGSSDSIQGEADNDADADANGAGGDSVIQSKEEQKLEVMADDQGESNETTMSSSSGTKKKRRRKRRAVAEKAVEVDNPANSLEQEGPIMDAVPEITKESPAMDDDPDDTAASRIKKTRRKRRRRATEVQPAVVAEESFMVEEEEERKEGPEEEGIRSVTDEPEDTPWDMAGEASEAGDTKKKKKRPKRRSKKVDSALSQSTSSATTDADPPTATIEIQTSIEIPDEELVPECSIGMPASMEIRDNLPMDRMGETPPDDGTAETDAEDNSSSGAAKKRRRRRKQRSDDPSSPAEEDKDVLENNASESSSPLSSSSDLSSTIAIDTSIEIPSEEIVPESIGTSVTVDENAMPVDTLLEEGGRGMEEEEPSSSMEVRVAAADEEEEEELEAPNTDKDADLEVLTEEGVVVSEETPKLLSTMDGDMHNAEDDETELIQEEIAVGPADDGEEVPQDVDTTTVETLPQSHVSINASIEVPSEDIVPESVDATLEIEETLEKMEPIMEDVDSLESGMENFSVSVVTKEGEEEDMATTSDTDTEMPEDLQSEVSETMAVEREEVESFKKEDSPIVVGSESQIHDPIEEVSEMEDESVSGDAEESITKGVEEEDDDEEEGEEDTEEEEDEEEEEEEELRVFDGGVHKEEKEIDISMEDEITMEDASNVGAGESPRDDQNEEEIIAKEVRGVDNENDSLEEADDELEERVQEGIEGNENITSDDSPDVDVTTQASILVEEDEDKIRETVDGAEEPTPETGQSNAIDALKDSKKVYENIAKEETVPTNPEQGEIDNGCLTFSMVTWNLAESAPSENEASFFKRFRKGNLAGAGSDLVMIGAQECEEIKPRRTEGHRSRHLRRMGIMMLGKEYVPLAIHSLGGIQCALYCHRDVLGDVEMINVADVTCGVGNVFHNKGAIGVYLKMNRRCSNDGLIKSSRMLFVTAHLAAHVKNVDARNNDFKRIVSELEARAPGRFLRPRKNRDGSLAECDGSYLLSSMDHIFFSGDLNYRIDLPREYVESCIIDIKRCDSKGGTNSGEVVSLMNKLLRRDQLLQTIASGLAFPGFNEGEITFLPTFKFDKGTSNYDTSHKQRVPAWTDRIVFRSNKVRVLEYQSAMEAKHSDHRPVFGTFHLGWGLTEKIKPRGVAKKSRRKSRQKKNRE